MSVYDALDRMKKADMHFALVCDEFGAMTGVITPADILDALVGLLPKQYPGIVKDGDNSWTVDAVLLFYDFLSYFGFEDLYTPASYSTVGGFILEELRRMPESGDTVVWNGLSFTACARWRPHPHCGFADAFSRARLVVAPLLANFGVSNQ